MKCNIHIRRLLAAAIVVGATTAGSLTGLARADVGSSSDPTRIDVPEGNRMFFAAHAKGAQIYSCKPSEGTFAWLLLAPRANLYDGKGKLVATHFGGQRGRQRT